MDQAADLETARKFAGEEKETPKSRPRGEESESLSWQIEIRIKLFGFAREPRSINNYN